MTMLPYDKLETLVRDEKGLVQEIVLLLGMKDVSPAVKKIATECMCCSVNCPSAIVGLLDVSRMGLAVIPQVLSQLLLTPSHHRPFGAYIFFTTFSLLTHSYVQLLWRGITRAMRWQKFSQCIGHLPKTDQIKFPGHGGCYQKLL